MASVALDTMPPWPESSPNRRNVTTMSFYDTLYATEFSATRLFADQVSRMYDASTPYDAPDPYGAPNAYENTLASLLDTDFPLPASPSRRGVLSPSQRGVLSPSRRRVLSRNSSSKSVFGDSTNGFANSANGFANSTNVFANSTNVFADSTNIFNDSTNIFANRTDANAAGSPGDSGENIFIDPKYAPGDRTESAGDLNESADETNPTDALETVTSLPGTSGIVFGGTAFATDLATFMTLPTYTTFPTFPAMTDEPPVLAIAPEGSIDKRPGEMYAPEAERGADDQEAVERANDDQETVVDAQGAHAAGVDAERAYEEDEHGIAGRSLIEIMSQFYPIPPDLLSHWPSVPPLPPSTSTDAPLPPSRAQSPASAIEFITRPHGFATDPAPCDPSYPATFDSPYPAPLDPHSQIEFATTQPDTAAQDGPAAGVQNNGDIEDHGGAENNGVGNKCVGNNGGARVGSVAEGARDGAAEGAQLISQPTSLATNAENNQTKPHRKARKYKGKGKVAVEDAIAPRATANKTAAQPAPHALTAAPASHSVAPASHSVATAAHSAAPASRSGVPEYVEMIEQQRQAKKARKARGTKGKAAVDSARTARAQEPAAAQSVARFTATIGNAAAGAAQASPSKSQQELAETSGVAAPPTAMPAPAQAMGMAAASMAPCVTSALQHGYAFSAAAPNAASSAPQPSLSNGSMGATIRLVRLTSTPSSRPPAPPTHASSGSSTGSMLWQALMKGELTMEEMQARLRSDVKSPPALEGARADVLRSVTLSEGPPVAPPSLRSSGIGTMGHPGASLSSTTLSRKHGHDAEPEDPNRKQCGWTHFDAQNKPMGPCTHFFNKKSDRETLKKNVRDHMRAMEPNRCDAIYCQWAHDCKRHDRYFSDLYAAVEHIVDIILGTETRVRR
ncbi:hypothetical protein FB107DRAFT_292254 [Schizophyllum commune]